MLLRELNRQASQLYLYEIDRVVKYLLMVANQSIRGIKPQWNRGELAGTEINEDSMLNYERTELRTGSG